MIEKKESNFGLKGCLVVIGIVLALILMAPMLEKAYNIVIALIVIGFFGWLIIAPLMNQIQFKKEQKEFLEFLETASLKELKRIYPEYERHGSPNDRKRILDKIEELEYELNEEA